MFIYISRGSNWDMSLSKVQMRKISKSMALKIIVINSKENKNPLVTNIQNLKKIFIKPRGNSRNKAEI